MNKYLIKHSLPSFCTANFNVIKILIIFAKYYNLPILLESTSNQVNQFGGYTGLTPRQFYKKIDKLKKKIKIKNKQVMIGADHLGPLPWKKLNSKIALKNAKTLIKKCISLKYDKIHIDSTIVCKDDKNLNLNLIRSRSAKIFNTVPKKDIKNIFFVFGSEVPFAGGGNTNKIKPSVLNNIKVDYFLYNSILKNLNSNKKNKFSLVVEPGMAFSNSKISLPKLKKFKKNLSFSKKNNFSYEAHSTDYQRLVTLKKLVKNNFRFLKVGPELTFDFYQAIKKMEKIEDTNCNQKSNISYELMKAMSKDNKYWKDYYKGTKKKIEFLKLNSYLDRMRYYWDSKNVKKSMIKLFKNIDTIPQKVLKKELKLKSNEEKQIDKINLKNSDYIIFYYLNSTIKKYYLACNFKLNNL